MIGNILALSYLLMGSTLSYLLMGLDSGVGINIGISFIFIIIN